MKAKLRAQEEKVAAASRVVEEVEEIPMWMVVEPAAEAAVVEEEPQESARDRAKRRMEAGVMYRPLTVRERLLDLLPRMGAQMTKSLRVYADEGQVTCPVFVMALLEAVFLDGRYYSNTDEVDFDSDNMRKVLELLFDELHSPHKGDKGELLSYRGQLLQVDVWENPTIRENPYNPRVLPITAIPSRIIKLKKNKDKKARQRELQEREEQEEAVLKLQMEKGWGFTQSSEHSESPRESPRVARARLYEASSTTLGSASFVPQAPGLKESQALKMAVRKKVDSARERQQSEADAREEARQKTIAKKSVEIAEVVKQQERDREEAREEARRQREKSPKAFRLPVVKPPPASDATRDPQQRRPKPDWGKVEGQAVIPLGGVAATLRNKGDSEVPPGGLRKGAKYQGGPPSPRYVAVKL